MSQLTFEEPDVESFPCLELAYKALKIGGTMPAALNAANEVAVQAFLDGQIKLSDIAARKPLGHGTAHGRGGR